MNASDEAALSGLVDAMSDARPPPTASAAEEQVTAGHCPRVHDRGETIFDRVVVGRLTE